MATSFTSRRVPLTGCLVRMYTWKVCALSWSYGIRHGNRYALQCQYGILRGFYVLVDVTP
jgi:hypothetical protein